MKEWMNEKLTTITTTGTTKSNRLIARKEKAVRSGTWTKNQTTTDTHSANTTFYIYDIFYQPYNYGDISI